MGNDGLCCRCGEIEPHGMDCHCPTEPCFALAQPAPSRCPVCGYIAGAVPSDFRAFAWANCERRDSHDKPAPAPAPLPEADETTIIGYDLASGPDKTVIFLNGQPITNADRDMLLGLLCSAPAPLPVEMEELLNIAQELPLGPNDAQDLRSYIDDLTRRLAVLENPVTFFCVHCRENFPATSDGLKAGMEHDLTCKSNPLVRRLAEVEDTARWEMNKRKCAEARLAELDAHYLAAGRHRAESEARVRELEAWARTWGCYSCAHAGKCPVSDRKVQAVLNGGLCVSWEIKDLQAALAATEVK